MSETEESSLLRKKSGAVHMCHLPPVRTYIDFSANSCILHLATREKDQWRQFDPIITIRHTQKTFCKKQCPSALSSNSDDEISFFS